VEQADDPRATSWRSRVGVAARSNVRCRLGSGSVMTPRAAAILAFGLLAAAVVHGGVYEGKIGGDGMLMYRLNRITGSVTVCSAEMCLPLRSGASPR